MIYELYEIDTFYNNLLERVAVVSSIKEAREKAKKLALGWCNSENELQQFKYKNSELWIGESDFGIFIKKVKHESVYNM